MTRRAAPLTPAEELAAAQAALAAAAATTAAAHEAVWAARTDRAEDRALARWNVAHDAQNAAARRLHAAEERARWTRDPITQRWVRA